MPIQFRAHTPEEKRAIVERLLAVWLTVPDLRFGQMLTNAMRDCSLFYVEDEVLASTVELFGGRHGSPQDPRE
jgi:hypothetical protein